MEAGGGLSVADLVQKHTGSRPNLTPVNPQESLQQNTLMHGRRSLPEDQHRPEPGAGGFPQDADARRSAPRQTGEDQGPTRPPTRNGFPPEAEAPRRNGTPGTPPHRSGPAASDGYANGAPASRDNGYPAHRDNDFPAARDHGAPQDSGYPASRDNGYSAPRDNDFPAARDNGHPSFRDGHSAPRGNGAPASRDNGYPESHSNGAPRDNSPAAFHTNGTPAPTTRDNGFPQDDAPRSAGFPPESARNGFPQDAEAPRRQGARRAGEASAYRPIPGEGPAAPNGFPPEAEAPRSRRASEARNGFPPEAEAPRRAPRVGEGSAPRHTSAQHNLPGDGFPPDSHRNGAGQASAHQAIPGEGFFDEAPGHNGVGQAPAHHSIPGDGFPPDSHRRNGVGQASANHNIPADGFPPDAPRNGVGQASAHHAIPGDGFFDEAPGRNGVGQASAHHSIPGDGSPDAEAPRRNGTRRAGEAPTGDGFPPHSPRNGVGQASAHHTIPGDGFFDEAPGRNGVGQASAHHSIPDAEAPRRTRRAGEAAAGDGFPPDSHRRNGVGQASAHHAIPADGFPDPEAPRRNNTRRANETSGDGFPPDSHRRNGARRANETPADGFPPDAPRNGVGQASAHHAIPGDGFPADPEAPRRAAARRGGPVDGPRTTHHTIPDSVVGQASAHHAIPADGFHDAEAPRRNGARRPGEGPGQASGRFPADASRQPGQGSDRFPIDDPRRQGTPLPANRPPAEPLSEPRLTPAAIDAPDSRKSTGVPPVPLPPPRRGDDDPIGMTAEMEAIGEDVQKRRTIDHTLARFSAVHDELKAEEREKKAKRRKLLPWQADDGEMDRLDDLDAAQSMAVRVPVVEPEPEPEPAADEVPQTRLQEKKLRRRLKGKLAGKFFAAGAAILVFVATAAAWGFKSYVESSAQTVEALDPNSAAIQDAAAQRGDENFLLVGSDTRSGAAAEDGVGDESAVGGARSDTVMIAHIPENRQRVVIVSFPRDLEVTRPACQGWNAKTGDYTAEQHPVAEQVKLNTAYQIGGPKCVTKMVQELSGLAVNHFVGIDFHGFKGMVEAVQGVEVCVERPLKDETLGTIVPEAGKNVRISGDQALNFVRARKVEGDPTSDYGRIIRQQRFLSSLLRKAMSSEVLLNPSKLTKFVDAFSKATFGDNIGIEQLFTLGQSMQGVDAGRVTFITVPTVGDSNENGNEDLRVDDTNALFEAVRQDTPLPGESPAKPADDASKKQDGPVDPKTIKIQVLNGGNETGGIAGDTADALAAQGFQIMRVDAAPENIDKLAVVKYSKGREAQAKTLQKAVPGSVLQEDPSMSGAIMLVVGPGFDGEVVSPTGQAAPPDLPNNLSTVNASDVSCA
jgi:LCP family protein required for cell wall assembly